MTREEREKAIYLLDNLRGMIEDNQGNDYDFALKKGIEALAQEPCEDAVSRKKLLKIYEDRFTELQKLKHLKDNKGAEDRQMGVNYCINILKELPPVTPKRRCSGNPNKSEIPTGSDLIARGDVINTIKETAQYHTGDSFNADRLIRYIKELNNQPLSVLPAEPKVEASGINEIVNKIRAEIKTMGGDIETIADVLAIIDKYRAESEE